MSELKEKSEGALLKYFGYKKFRPLQLEIIQDFLEGNDVTVLMPTGGGKSICYQIPALVKEGTLIVISPLIALMKDQVEGLVGNGIQATYLNSSQTGKQQEDVVAKLLEGTIDLLYISPERLLSQDFFSVVKSIKLIGFAVDEAHCISSWGHDFRQDYTQLHLLKKNFPHLPIIALTATADRLTQKDIVDQLKLVSPKSYKASFNRPNLSLNVVPGKDRVKTIIQFLRDRPNTSGIIYCMSRKSTEKLAEKIQKAGYKALAYHAGLSDLERSKSQERFINDEVPIICATIAFGMGIDKSNVRWVIHYNLPKNMEGYYQEIGRAGRDGLPAETLLMYSYADVVQQQHFIEDSSQKEFLTAKLNRLRNYTEARICRRKILLSYFGDHLEEDCGNCDVCEHPPEIFDATIIAQKALSAIVRVKEQEPLNMIINIIRGAQQHEVFEKGYQQLPTYGVGKSNSYKEWQQWMLQLLNLGYFEVAYDRHNALFVTKLGKEVLYEGRKVELVKLSVNEIQVKTPVKRKSKTEQAEEDLFDTLRQWRKSVAAKEGKPPYQVLTDATLRELVREKPTDIIDLPNISGIGEYKMELYGNDIIKIIFDFKKDQSFLKGATHLKTLDLYQRGFDIDQIAKERDISRVTVINHFVVLIGKGEDIDVSNILTSRAKEVLFEYFNSAPSNIGLKEVFEHFNQQFSYEVIQIARAVFQREKA
jgi:ATP-dependent DNA helicase RecQ